LTVIQNENEPLIYNQWCSRGGIRENAVPLFWGGMLFP